MTEFALNPSLDARALADHYATRRRIHIPELLVDAHAEQLARCLEAEVPWGFAWFDGTEPRYHRAEALRALTREAQQSLHKEIFQVAGSGFQYAYRTYPMLDAYLQGWGQVPLLDRLLDFINSPTMLEFVGQVTGHADIARGDAQATCFGPGHFLKFHDDAQEDDRIAAFVMNFTRRWHPDWGGYLQFYDERMDIEEAFLPRFNALNMFSVPQHHSVSYVANYAAGQRYSVTGWFRRARQG
ncbi:MAG: 2OG-Fe(II) oxygenase family protein [Pseudomonadota bacterium]